MPSWQEPRPSKLDGQNKNSILAFVLKGHAFNRPDKAHGMSWGLQPPRDVFRDFPPNAALFRSTIMPAVPYCAFVPKTEVAPGYKSSSRAFFSRGPPEGARPTAGGRVATVFRPSQTTNEGALGPSHLGTEDRKDLGIPDIAGVWSPIRTEPLLSESIEAI